MTVLQTFNKYSGIESQKCLDYNLFTLANVLAHFGTFGVITYMPLIAVSEGLSKEDVSKILLISGGVDVVTRLPSGFLIDKLLHMAPTGRVTDVLVQRKFFSACGSL